MKHLKTFEDFVNENYSVTEKVKELEIGKTYKASRKFGTGSNSIDKGAEVEILDIGNNFAEIEVFDGPFGMGTKMEVEISDLEKYLVESVNEAAKYKGSFVYPEWLSGDDFGAHVKSERDLVVGQNYILKDYGDNNWHGDYEYREFDGEFYTFVDSAQFSHGGEFQVTPEELKDMIKSKEIYKQK